MYKSILKISITIARIKIDNITIYIKDESKSKKKMIYEMRTKHLSAGTFTKKHVSLSALQ